MNEFDQPPAAPPAPPTVAGPLQREVPPVWPRVIGIIMIVLGALGFLTWTWGAVAPFFIEQFNSMVQSSSASMQQQNFTGMEGLMKYRYENVVSNCMAAMVSILLVVTGIQLLRRRCAARNMALVWAWLKIVISVAACVVMYLTQLAQFEAMESDPQMSGIQGMGSIKSVTLFFMVAISLLWGWALPVFVLIWFNRRTIKEQVAAWP